MRIKIGIKCNVLLCIRKIGAEMDGLLSGKGVWLWIQEMANGTKNARFDSVSL
jgi:hypothetical protein